MYDRKASEISVIVLVVIIASGCATSPAIPSWVMRTPSPDATNTWFVGFATGVDLVAAEKDAVSGLIAEIMQYLGVDVKVSTSSTMKASLTAYEEELRQTVETKSDNRLSGFKVSQRWTKNDLATGKVTVYILASYLTADLNKEKARLAALVQERADAVSKPEAEGDALAASGQALEAADRYIQAMAAASGEGIDNAEVKLERNADKARRQIASLTLVQAGPPEIDAVMGTAPLRGVELRLVGGSPGSEAPIPGAYLSLSYPRKLASGKLGTKTEALRTGQDGALKFTLPTPDFVGTGRIVVQLDLSSSMQLLDKIPKKYDALVAALDDEIRGKSVEITYRVSSRAATLPLALFVLDVDEKGGEGQVGSVQAGLAEAFGRQGFTLKPLSLQPSLLSATDAQLLAAVRATLPVLTGRFVGGSGRILSVRRDGAFYVASAAGSIKVYDLSTGAVLYAADKSWQAIASDEASARRAVLRELGSKVFGEDILSSLP